MVKRQEQRWIFKTIEAEHLVKLQAELEACLPTYSQFHPLLARLLANRDVESPQEFLDPTRSKLPHPKDEFIDLTNAVTILTSAIRRGDEIAICGDYDADGMTSTALLLRTFRRLGGKARYKIPSRMTEGYGINERIVRDLHEQGVSIVVTVDNGIAAIEPIALAKQLGLAVIVTDHHDIPKDIPPADAILNPKQLVPESPYAGMAGVGVAYLLALELAAEFGERERLERPLLELLTLGTIADLAPLTGINRRWVKQGLALLPHSQMAGIQALMQVSGLSDRRETLQPEAIGFGLGPRINAVGRLAQPAVVIELLTTDDDGVALEQAMQCESLNQQRRQLCSDIEAEAIARIEQEGIDPKRDRILAILGEGWHHGVIGIVASRLLERYCVPVFIGSLEGESIRGSARGIPGFNVFEAIQYCRDLFEKSGGHPAAGGFSMQAQHWPELQVALKEHARDVLEPGDLTPLVNVDADLALDTINAALFDCLQLLQPYGIGNREPVFALHNLNVIQQRQIGKDKAHLKVQLREQSGGVPKTAIAWRGGEQFPLPDTVDVVCSLKQNRWQGEVAIELELNGIRATHPNPQMRSSQPDRKIRPQKRQQPALHYSAAPEVTHNLNWHNPNWNPSDSSVSQLPSVSGNQLLYGFRHPKPQTPSVHCDRPHPAVVYRQIIFWTLPPSLTHLNWLLARTTPASPDGHHIYICSHSVPIPTAEELQQRLEAHLNKAWDINLLQTGQQWWVAPSTIVAGLRSLGYPCHQFPKTQTVARELENLGRWYTASARDLATLSSSVTSAPG
ncbi:MAG: single-stranded-DNA-specific exonuclease RecJ [Synechococcus sp.]